MNGLEKLKAYIVIDDEESEVRQEAEGNNLVINARLY
jgi:hypothetical protein